MSEADTQEGRGPFYGYPALPNNPGAHLFRFLQQEFIAQ